MRVRAATPGEIRGWHVLVMMLAFFAAIIAVNVVFAIEAVRTFPGEDAQQPYLQGIHYNQTLADRRAQAALGWNASAELQPTSDGVALVVVLRDKAGAPLDGLALQGALRWPTDAARDRALVFTPEGAGRYRASLSALAQGDWRLRAHASNAHGGALDFDADLTWRR